MQSEEMRQEEPHIEFETSQTSGPLKKLPSGPWTSLGGYLDYASWPERDRFLELDRALLVWRENEREDRQSEFARQPREHRRCRAKVEEGGNCNAYFTLTPDYDGWKCERHRAASGPALCSGSLSQAEEREPRAA
jgi:hypothetical protein